MMGPKSGKKTTFPAIFPSKQEIVSCPLVGFLKEILGGFTSERHVTIWYLYCVPILAKLMCNLKSYQMRPLFSFQCL